MFGISGGSGDYNWTREEGGSENVHAIPQKKRKTSTIQSKKVSGLREWHYGSKISMNGIPSQNLPDTSGLLEDRNCCRCLK